MTPETSAQNCAEFIIGKLLDSPLEHAGRTAVETLVYDALAGSGVYEALASARSERLQAEVWRSEVEHWKTRAERADDRDACEHCGTTEGELTRSAVSCQPCLVKLLSRELRT